MKNQQGQVGVGRDPASAAGLGTGTIRARRLGRGGGLAPSLC
jgi:hypothetical protein